MNGFFTTSESFEGAQNDIAARSLSEGMVPDGLIELKQTSFVGLRLVLGSAFVNPNG
jgi:hypothetical protein